MFHCVEYKAKANSKYQYFSKSTFVFLCYILREFSKHYCDDSNIDCFLYTYFALKIIYLFIPLDIRILKIPDILCYIFGYNEKRMN